MKLLHFLLLLPVAALSQNISVVSAEKMNVVYRGIDNPIKIAVPGAKSFTATAPGMRTTDEPGKYLIAPGPGLEAKVAIEAQMEDGTTLHEEKVFRIKGLPSPTGTINGYNSDGGVLGLSKNELISGLIGMEMHDFLFEVKFSVTSFSIGFPGRKRMKTIYIEGNLMNDEATKAISKLKSGDLVLISDIGFGDPLVCHKRVFPILIRIDGERFSYSTD